MKEVYIVFMDTYYDSILTGKFSDTLHGTIGIVKDHYEDFYGEGMEFMDFMFGEPDEHGDVDMTYKYRYSWNDDWDSGSCRIEKFTNITHKE